MTGSSRGKAYETQSLHASALHRLPNGSHHDGRGLFFIVDGDKRRWRLRMTVKGKRVNRGLGTLADVTLSQARAKADTMRMAGLAGVDAGVRTSAPAKPAVPTFADVLAEVVNARVAAEKLKPCEVRRWQVEFARHASSLMVRPVDQITTGDIIRVMEAPDIPASARQRIRIRIPVVMVRAKMMGYRGDNPAVREELREASPAPRQAHRHHAAVPHSDVRKAVLAIRGPRLSPFVKLAIQFIILTAARSAEVRGATWDEIDMDACLWTIPGERMKGGAVHRVPLSGAAMSLLHEARARFGGKGLVFPGRTGEHLTSTLSRSLNKAGVTATVHGFRSSFRDWCAETGVPREIAESALAHAKPSAVIAAYERTDFLDKRQALMQTWADYVHT